MPNGINPLFFNLQPILPVTSQKGCLFLNDNSHQALGILDVDGLDVAVELLLGVLLVVSSAADADAESVGNALDTLLPDLLVELRVEADIGSALQEKKTIAD